MNCSEFSIRFLSALQLAEQITDEASLFVNYRYNYVVDGVTIMHLLTEKGLRGKYLAQRAYATNATTPLETWTLRFSGC